MYKKLISTTVVFTILLLAACSIKPTYNQADNFMSLNTLYDYRVIKSSNKKSISINRLAKELKNKQVIFIGEFHSHQASHKLQLDLLQALYHQNPNLILSMEQFTRDAQPIINGYLASEYGEQTLINEGKAWDHYKGSYRALVEFSKEHNIPIIAANAPAMFVRCVGRKGVEILKTLPEEQAVLAARKLDLENEKYKEKFMSYIQSAGRSHGQTKEEMSKRQLNTYAAQLLRDTTMAESIDAAMKKYPNNQVIHLNGSFHSDSHLGTVAVLETMLPKSDISVLSPVMVEDAINPKAQAEEYSQGDYIYLLKALPERFLDKDKENESIRKLIMARMKKKCEL